MKKGLKNTKTDPLTPHVSKNWKIGLKNPQQTIQIDQHTPSSQEWTKLWHENVKKGAQKYEKLIPGPPTIVKYRKIDLKNPQQTIRIDQHTPSSQEWTKLWHENVKKRGSEI